MQQGNLGNIRKQIDEIDGRLVELLNQRAKLALKAGATKKDQTKLRTSREAEVIASVKQANKGPLSDQALEAMMRQVISGCLNLEQPLRVSYLGPEGTYSEQAACMRFGDMATFLPSPSLDETVRLVETGSADVAVLPIENSIEGSVGRSLDLLAETSLKICDELLLPIHHQLLAKGELADITEVVAHPQALAQCRTWLTTHVPQATQIAASSNGEAARNATKTRAAIASSQAAKVYNLNIVAENIEDDPANTTRFVVLGQLPTSPTGRDKTSLVCAVPNSAGALNDALQVLAENNVNMVKLESRPAPGSLWEYVFYIDIEGHEKKQNVAAALAALKTKAAFVKVKGSYPRGV